MRIAIDARELAGRPTGTGRYLANLLAQWRSLPAAARHRFTLYAPSPVDVRTSQAVELRVLRGTGGTRWEQSTLAAALRRDRPDVLFAPAYTAPLLAGCPVALVVHDVSFAAHPEWYGRVEGTRRRLITCAAARRAQRVLTVSEFSRREIERHLGVPGDRIRVVLHGVATPAPPPAGVRREPLVLYVGSLFNRRHLPELIAAFALVVHRVPEARLVVVGDDRTFPPQDLAGDVERLGLSSRVRLASYVADSELVELYARASAFAFLSEYEGFGLTPLEALAAGVPGVVLDTPVAREIYGEAAEFLPDPSPTRTADALVRLLTRQDTRARLLGAAPAVLSRYRWDAAAAATLTAITEAAGA